MMTAKSKGSFLMTLGMLLIITNASLTTSSENFAEEAGQTNIDVALYGEKTPLKTEGDTKSTEQPVTNKDKKTLRQQNKMSGKNTTKTDPTTAQTSLPRTSERSSTWLYNLGTACLLVALVSFYCLNRKREKEK